MMPENLLPHAQSHSQRLASLINLRLSHTISRQLDETYSNQTIPLAIVLSKSNENCHSFSDDNSNADDAELDASGVCAPQLPTIKHDTTTNAITQPTTPRILNAAIICSRVFDAREREAAATRSIGGSSRPFCSGASNVLQSIRGRLPRKFSRQHHIKPSSNLVRSLMFALTFVDDD